MNAFGRYARRAAKSTLRQFSGITYRHDVGTRLLSGLERPASISVPLQKRMKEEAQRRRSSSEALRAKFQTLSSSWELTVGIEIHAQLNTTRKLFSDAILPSVEAEPNAHVAVFDAAIPGSQPIFQHETLVPAIRAALALECQIQPWCAFDRKHYFHWDQPAGYQITQYFHPLAKDGHVVLYAHDCTSLAQPTKVGIKQIQLEQDTAQTLTQDSRYLIDLNRVGAPLVEIVSEPDIHTPETAAAYLRKVQSLLKSVNACVVGMEWGGLRADVNVSVQPRLNPAATEPTLGRRTEIKNLSSFKSIEDAVRAEMIRQVELLQDGKSVLRETRGWAIGAVETTKLRDKDREVDYRYMQDADISPIHIDPSVVSHLQSTLPSLPDALLAKYTAPPYKLTAKDALSLLRHEDPGRLDMYSTCYDKVKAKLGSKKSGKDIGKLVGNWVLHEYGGLDNASTLLPGDPLLAEQLSVIVSLVAEGKITGAIGKKALEAVTSGKTRETHNFLDEHSLWTNHMSDHELRALAKRIFGENADMVRQVRKKQDRKKARFFVGRMIQVAGKERVEPRRAEEMVQELLFDTAI